MMRLIMMVSNYWILTTGKIHLEDEDFSYLKIWIDKNSDLINTEDEVLPNDLE